MDSEMHNGVVERTSGVRWQALDAEEAATAVEYAVLLAVVLLVAIAGITLLGQKNAAIWTAVGDAIGAVL